MIEFTKIMKKIISKYKLVDDVNKYIKYVLDDGGYCMSDHFIEDALDVLFDISREILII
jgi:hypothetical protein